jgi:DNA topoisomerase-3
VGDTLITWAYGHLAGLAEPAAYDPAWRRWAWDTLPLLPDPFRVAPTPQGAQPLRAITALLARADVTDVVCATDADREGELIFRWIYRLSGCRKPVWRLWLSENTPAAIREAFDRLQPAGAYDALAAAAEARAQADWLVGLNATRAVTLRHGQPGQGPLSVGRVQTPTLRLIADRDQAIAAFRPEPYWTVRVTFAAPEGRYVGLWQRPEADADGRPDRLPTAAAAEAVAARVPPGTPGRILTVDRKTVTVTPPLLFNLNDLQKDANRRWGLTAQQTLDAAQSLYERHLTSYPRTDARHLTAEMAATVPRRLQGLQAAYPGLLPLAAPDVQRVTDDAAVAEAGHTAIIPTGQTPPADLPDRERQVFDLIARRFIAALMPAGRDARTTVWTEAGGERFKTAGTAVVDPGWRQALAPVNEADDGKTADDNPAAIPPGLHDGETVMVQAVETPQGETKPPARLTDASLLAFMEKHGLGTPATRARIVETLLSRGYVERVKKALQSTEKGRKLLPLLPDAIQSPDLTGRWEAQLEAIAHGHGDADAFLADIRRFTADLVAQARRQAAQAVADDFGPCPVCRTGRVIAGRRAWGCSRWREGCRFTLWKEVAGKRLTDAQAKTILAGRTTGVLTGFRSKAGQPFNARLRLDSDGRVAFVFDAPAPRRAGPGRRGKTAGAP